MDNLAIARVLAEIGDLLEIKNENPFKIRAYRNAAETVANHPDRVASLAPAERLALPASARTSRPRSASSWTPASSPFTRICSRNFRRRSSISCTCRVSARRPWPSCITSSASARSTTSRPPAGRDGLRGLKGMGAKKEAQILRALEERTRLAGRRLIAEAATPRPRSWRRSVTRAPAARSPWSAACAVAARPAATSTSSPPARPTA